MVAVVVATKNANLLVKHLPQARQAGEQPFLFTSRRAQHGFEAEKKTETANFMFTNGPEGGWG